MSWRMPYHPEAFTKDGSRDKKKRPREKSEGHLAFIRKLPSILSGKRDRVQAAHIRYADPLYAKRKTGIGEKAHDKFTVPLTAAEHLDGEDAQHKSNERAWWEKHGIDPLQVAAALWMVSGDEEAGERIIHEFRKKAGRA